MEHTKRVIKSLEIAANKNKDNFSETMVVGTKSILAITEAFRLTERRAEAAEAEVQRLNATAQPVSDGWVKCSDGYPEIGEEVLIRIPVCDYRNIENAKYQGKGKFLGAWLSFRGEGCTYNVTHWMPLPAAPGGQD